MTSSRSPPCLPEKLLNEFKQDALIYSHSTPSMIFSDRFERFRAKALSQKISFDAEVVRSPPSTSAQGEAMRKLDGFIKGQGRTFLHLAVRDTDIPLAYEAIRIGVTVDCKDTNGATPLFAACQTIRQIRAVKDGHQDVPQAQRAEGLRDDLLDAEIARVLRIARLLVEQHANVNLDVEGQTPLSLAAEGACWPLVELLIRHGAQVPAAGSAEFPRFQSAHRKSRFQAITRTVKTAYPRPARPCPCWSGKLLAICHAAKALPYPQEYICRCGTNKTYERCCMKKQFRWEEKWISEDDWIGPVRVLSVPMPQDETFRTGFQNSRNLLEQMAKDGGPEYFTGGLQKEMASFWQAELGRLPPGTMDPAFLYALKSVDFIPRPWTGQLSRVESKKRMDEWNTAVDKYMALGKDDRDAFDIEFAAKIGPNGGPLYKECENCWAVEGRDVFWKMKCCSRCRLIVYCSPECQADNWTEHKAKCKDKSHREQQLKGTTVIETLSNTYTREMAGIDSDMLRRLSRLASSSLPGMSR